MRGILESTVQQTYEASFQPRKKSKSVTYGESDDDDDELPLHVSNRIQWRRLICNCLTKWSRTLYQRCTDVLWFQTGASSIKLSYAIHNILRYWYIHYAWRSVTREGVEDRWNNMMRYRLFNTAKSIMSYNGWTVQNNFKCTGKQKQFPKIYTKQKKINQIPVVLISTITSNKQ